MLLRNEEWDCCQYSAGVWKSLPLLPFLVLLIALKLLFWCLAAIAQQVSCSGVAFSFTLFWGHKGLTDSASMFPKTFHWAMLALDSASVFCNTFSLKCVLETFNTDVTLFHILLLDGIVSLGFSLASALTHGLSGIGFLSEGQVMCSLILVTTMPPYINGILCSLMISVMR